MSKPYIYVECDNCKGTGKVIDHALGVWGFGIGYLVQAVDDGFKIDCPECDGYGKNKKRVYID